MDCYQQAIQTIKSYESHWEGTISKTNVREILAAPYQRTRFTILSEKPKHTVVLLHGLWGDGRQFTDLASWLALRGFNVVSVVLPGHGLDAKNLTASHRDWLREVDNILGVTKHLSDEVIVVGQSTGGILALYAALEYPNQVSGLMLVEPAFSVQEYLTFGACIGSIIFTKMEDVEWLTRLIGIGSVTGNVNLGCEVNKIKSFLESRYAPGYCDCASIESSALNHNQALNNLFSKIKVPTYLVNNLTDKVVDPNAITAFKQYSAGPVTYIETNDEGVIQQDSDNKIKLSNINVDHGETWKLWPEIKDSFANFLVKNTGMSESVSNGDYLQKRLKEEDDLSMLIQRFYLRKEDAANVPDKVSLTGNNPSQRIRTQYGFHNLKYYLSSFDSTYCNDKDCKEKKNLLKETINELEQLAKEEDDNKTFINSIHEIWRNSLPYKQEQVIKLEKFMANIKKFFAKDDTKNLMIYLDERQKKNIEIRQSVDAKFLDFSK